MGRYISITEIRKAPDLSNSTTVPDSIITEAISAAEEAIDLYCGVSFSTQSKTRTFVGEGGTIKVVRELYLQEITSASKDSTSLDTDSFTVSPGGLITYSEGFTKGSKFSLTYNYGYSTTPDLVKYVARIEGQRRTRAIMTKGRQRNSGTQVANEHGQFTYPNWSGKYGISDDAEVLRALNQLREATNARFSV